LELAGPQRSAEINRRRFAAILANEDTAARNNLAGAEQIKTLPRTLTLLAAQAAKPVAQGGR
jgi:hypothetical protein